MTLRTPDEMMAGAREQMLDGREPSTRKDWQLVFNFLAANILPEAQPACLYLLAMMYDCPLTRPEIAEISEFQVKERK